MKEAPLAERSSPIRIAKPFSNKKMEESISSILRSGRLVQGKYVEEFEHALSSYIGCKYAICLNSGTAALHSSIMALKMSGSEKNEVITTPLSFAATANAVIHAGCRPVFVDVQSDTFNIDPGVIEQRINDRTLAVEPVDVYGLPADLDEIKRVVNSKGIPIVEDAAEAIGAMYSGKKIGSISTLSCFSTYATKNLHTAEGGFVTTNNEALANSIKMIRNQGQSSRYNQTILGYNFRMMEICAAMGLEQLPLLDGFNEMRRKNALYLKEGLSKLDSIGFQKVDNPRDHSWYLFSLLLDESKSSISRDALVTKLKETGIEADVAWPTPIHLQPYFQETFGFRKGELPVAEGICKQIFQLPIQPFLSQEELDRILSTMKEILG